MKRQPSYTGPLCPTDAAHGPLLSWAGTSGFFCPHSAHAIPASKGESLAETVRWFTLEEVEAANARLMGAAS